MTVKEAIMLRNKNKKTGRVIQYVRQTICFPKLNCLEHYEEEREHWCLGSLPCCGMKHQPMGLEAF